MNFMLIQQMRMENYNSNTIGDILEKISTKDPLYQNIKYSDIKESYEGKIIIKYKIMTYQDFGMNLITSIKSFL